MITSLARCQERCVIWLNYASFLVILLAFASLLTVIYLAVFQDNPPASFNNLPWPTDQRYYAPNSIVSVDVDFCLHTQAPNTSPTVMIAGPQITYFAQPISTQAIPTAIIKGALQTRCLHRFLPIVQLPPDIAPGVYHLEGMPVYQVNPLARRVASWRTADFMVQ